MPFDKSIRRKKRSRLRVVTLRPSNVHVEVIEAQCPKLPRALDLAWELFSDQAQLLESNCTACSKVNRLGCEPGDLGALGLKKPVAVDRLHPEFQVLPSRVRQELGIWISEGQPRWFEALRKRRACLGPSRPVAHKYVRSFTNMPA